jgi:CheY-like chemotaxis protein
MEDAADKMKSLVVVEDDEDDQFFLQTAFEEIGFNQHVVYLDSCSQLFEYLEQTGKASRYPYAILLDYNMPVMNGEQVLIKLKEHNDYRAIQILIYSTDISELQVQALKKYGAADCYVKSYSQSEIIDFAKFLQQKIAKAVFR